MDILSDKTDLLQWRVIYSEIVSIAERKGFSMKKAKVFDVQTNVLHALKGSLYINIAPSKWPQTNLFCLGKWLLLVAQVFWG